MPSFNKIQIIGYLGRDPELRYTPDSTPVVNFSVATTEKRKDITGEMREITTWFRVTMWGRQAELANNFLSKGSFVFVEGRFALNEYTDKQGEKRASAEVRASDFQVLSKKEDAPTKEPKGRTAKPEVDPDDIPF